MVRRLHVALDPHVALALCECYVVTGDPDSVINMTEEVVPLDDVSSMLVVYRAAALRMRGNLRAAAACAQSVVAATHADSAVRELARKELSRMPFVRGSDSAADNSSEQDLLLLADEEVLALAFEVETVEWVVAAAEEAIATKRIEIDAAVFEHGRRIAPLLAKLDELELAILSVRATKLNDPVAERDLAAATEDAAASAAAAAGAAREERSAPVPSDDLRALYREVARLVHPDLGTNDDDRARRTAAMVDANAAYQASDEVGLRHLLDRWRTAGPTPPTARPSDTRARLESRLEALNRVLERLRQMQLELDESVGGQLLASVREARRQGSDYFRNLESRLNARIAAASATLEALDA